MDIVYIAVFDIGTSAVKGVLIDEKATLNGQYIVQLETFYGEHGEIEQNPEDWWNAIIEIAKFWWNNLNIAAEDISIITFTGQMEDVVPITENVNHRAILYSDTRARAEAEQVNKALPSINTRIGNTVTASTPIAKLLWLKHNKPETYEDMNHFVFSAKDYVIYKLADVFVTDPTTAATTGMMNLNSCKWDEKVIRTMRVDAEKLPSIFRAAEMVGTITEDAAKETGFSHHTPILCGCGDAGATTMGASAVKKNDCYFYLGTTGWAAVIQDKAQVSSDNESGVFNLTHLPRGLNVSIAPLLNVGNVHRWGVNLIGEQEDNYDMFEELISNAPSGSNGVLFLPYLNGERNPVNDEEAKGAFWGITPNTTKADLMRSIMEGVAYSLKQLLEKLITKEIEVITLVGGGAKSETWCQILSDMLGTTIRVPVDSEFMPAIGVSSTGFIKLGLAHNYRDFTEQFLDKKTERVFQPNKENYALYKKEYKRYLKLYPGMREVYQ